jgi:hypothetical protein
MIKKIDSITVVSEIDYDPDLSDIGEWTNEFSVGVMDSSTGEFVSEPLPSEYVSGYPSYYRYIKPYAGGEEVGSPEYETYAKQDFETLKKIEKNEIWFVHIFARAKIVIHNTIQVIETPGIWGIEVWDDESLSEAYDESGKDEISNLKNILYVLSFTPEEFDSLMVEYKET